MLEKHISTHSERSVEDRAAVKTLDALLLSDGRINTCFSCDDKWPNHDGTFEFVSDPDMSRNPEQVFMVQIKGTHNYCEKDGVISYNLQSLAFPAFVALEVTADPGILFVIINPDIRGRKRVFWKYMSPSFIKSIKFEQGSAVIHLYAEDEIMDTDEGIDDFCKKLEHIVETHLFIRGLDKECLGEKEALEIIKYRSQEISSVIDECSCNVELRDKISRKIVKGLYDLCYSVLILNAIKEGYNDVNERLAWEVAQFRPETKYLYNFLKGLKYIGLRIPDDGQSERLMLKYHCYLWEIRKFMKGGFDIDILCNLEKFPKNMDKLDEEYYEIVAEKIEKTDTTPHNVRVSRYYIQKKIPFFVCGERYFEITLQLAGLYATKYNRVTVYSKQNISTDYSIQIAYSEAEITLWNIKSHIKILNNWKVSIMPTCLNKMGKMIKMTHAINSKYGEYISLMNFLTGTGMSLLDIINLQEDRFKEVYNNIYGSSNTCFFGDTLMKLRNDYANSSGKIGKYTIRYALVNMKEEIFEELLPTSYYGKTLSDELNITSRCYPFEKNPFISNIVGRKSSKNDLDSIYEIVDNREKVGVVAPYLRIKEITNKTGELYFDSSIIASAEDIEKYNNSLDNWERNNGFRINEDNGMVYIDAYEKTTIYILSRLIELTKYTNHEQKKNNERYLKDCGISFEDPLKKIALKNAFVYSQIMLVYGAAGTGKTTLLKYVSDMESQYSQLFLAKTHTAVQNLKRRIGNNENAIFSSIDSIIKSGLVLDYDIVFVDECSTIDNRTMRSLMELIKKETKLVLSGDIYQIESIEFGNWFYYAKDIIHARGSNIELLHNWRTEKEELKGLWEEVREKKPIIVEKLSMDGPFSDNLGENIFSSEDDDEIVLCLNYDGKFGLNNMNQYFQNANNTGVAFSWAEWTFKVGDRILFIDTKRFSILYNNLKGKIVDIDKHDSMIYFTIDVNIFLSEEQCDAEDIEYISKTREGTRICIDVIAWDDEMSEEDKKRTVIPFQIAYAVSIHKAQGLEYNSVKVIIPSSNAEKITHSIFYTAITRAKEKLKIYWSPETMQSVVKSFTEENMEQKTLLTIKEKLKTSMKA